VGLVAHVRGVRDFGFVLSTGASQIAIDSRAWQLSRFCDAQPPDWKPLDRSMPFAALHKSLSISGVLRISSAPNGAIVIGRLRKAALLGGFS
jgi:hypothetical protein